MPNKRKITPVVALIASISLPAAAAEKLVYKTFPFTVLVNQEVAKAEGEPLPAELVNMLVPVNHQDCKEILFFPEAELTRFDVQPSYTVSFEETLNPSGLQEEAAERVLNTLQRRMGMKPEAADIQNVAREKLLAIKVDGKLVASTPSGDALKTGRPWEVIERTGIKRLIVTPGPDDQEMAEALRQKGVELKVIENPARVSAELGRTLCSIDVSSTEAPRFVVWYKPAGPHPQPGRKNGPLPESVQHVRQGLTYISLAKGARGAQEKKENYRNAEDSFSAAIDSEEQRGGCYAKAYMNRGLVYALQDKPRLALRDLTKAVECDPEDAVIRYNLAAVHSLSGDNDLSIEALDAALVRGFSDCNALRDDPDLKNARKVPEYRETLEKHKLFCF
jgi:tetratricopeptide (TPR) repeat protein